MYAFQPRQSLRPADGSSATFIADTDVFDSLDGETPSNTRSGYLSLRDGTRFRIDDQGRCAWMRDRNGNMVSFSYSFDNSVGTFRLTGINDSIGRQISFNQTLINSSIVERRIDFVGFGGAPRTISVQYTNLGNVLRSGFNLRTRQDLFPQLNGADGNLEDPQVVSSITLPNNQQYKFYYNSYAELARVEISAGGAIEYDYVPGLTDGPESGYLYLGVAGGHHIYRRVVERRVYPDGGSGGSFAMRTTYSRPESSASNAGYVQTDQYDTAGAVLGSQRHYFYGSARVSFAKEPTRYSPWQEGLEYQTDELAADRATVLRRVTHTLSQPVAGSHWPLTQPETQADAKPNDPHITQTLTTLFDVTPNLVSKTTFAYDEHNNLTDVYVYDFGAGAPGPLIRRAHTDYVTLNNGVDYAADTNIHIRNLPLRQQVFDAGGTKRAETFYEYDLYDDSPNHAQLINRQGISGLDSGFTTGYTTRGNVTRTSSALLNNSGGVTSWVNSHAQYDIAGNVVKVIDAIGNAIQFDFRDNFGSPDDPAVQSSENPANNAPGELGGRMSYAFPFKITNALGHKAYTKYDYHLGRPALSEDANGVKSNTYFNDALDRPTRGVRAIGTPAASQSVFVYNDSDSPVNGYPARSITTISDKDVFGESNSGNGLKSVALFDGLGRTWRGAAYEGDTWSIKDTQFDALGRVSQVSNPYRAPDPGSASTPSGLWTTTEYDALGRVVKVTTPDGAHVDMAYSGNNTLVIDQAGKMRISRTDALGRLNNVWEVRSPHAASGTVSVSFPNHPEITAGYQTDYLYDPLGNLRKVTQGAQTRWFAYDSLSRLIRAKNPEQDVNADPNMSYTDPVTGHTGWSTAYKYDPNGNLTEKIDARNIKTTYGYDELNRNKTVTYSDSTPGITRTYDTATLGKGRLQKTETAGSMGSRVTINDYDAMGRPKSQSQQFFYLGAWGTSFTTQQIYDLAGDVNTVTYPSGRTVNYSYDQAGRLSVFSGNLGGSPRNYADTISYNAAGQMIKERFGTNASLYHNSHYNNRMQMVTTRLGDSETDEWNWSRGAIGFYYGTTAVNTGDLFASDTDNNGNLRRQANYVPLAGGGYVIPQRDDYTYDALNRVNSFTEGQMDGGGQWVLNVAWQNFSYDRYGNRQITGASAASGGVSNYNPGYDPATNRINGLGYDAAGNITSDPMTGGSMIYDAENRLLTATKGEVGSTYTYDADGKRVRRIIGVQETWQVYGIGGELLAEYAADASPSAPQKEYGYRGGQLLIIAESGSGGGVSFVKPALKSSADLIGKAGLEADGNADELSVVDEPVADLEFNEDSGSTTADASGKNNTGALIDNGVTGTTAGEYGNALSFNGIGGALPAEHPAGVAPSAPQKEYGYRGGRSIVTAQGGDVVTLNPSANQSPDPGQVGTLAVTDITNTGHGNTPTGVHASDLQSQPTKNITQTKSARWSSFQSGPSGGIIGLKLKFDWTASGNVSASVEVGGSASARIDFGIDYSIDGGSSWTSALSRFRQVSQSGEGSNGDGISDGGSVEVVLSPSQDISLVQVRDFMRANATANAPGAVSEAFAESSAGITTSVSHISLEVESDTTAPVISNVAAGGITATGATITWNTNENSDSQVEYGTTTSYGQSTTLNPALVTAHSQGLSGLNSDTLYHYRVKSKDATGNLAMSADFTFRTPDITAPGISGVAAGSLTATGATITWNTNENSDSQVEYGTTTSYGQSTTLNPALVTVHSQGLSGLAPETLYHYRVKSKDAAGNLAVSGDVTFTTAQNGSALIKWLVTDHLGSTRMVIDETGSLAGIKRHDFLPFGEELSAGIRSGALGYGDDSVRQKFTGYERDETRLDFAQARYYASVQGRFTSPDSFFGRKTNPQTLNLYAYVLNNPLKWADPTGHSPQDPKKGEIEDCKCKFQIPVEKPGGFFSKIWGGLKKIGSAIGGAVGNIGSGMYHDFREAANDPHNPFRPIDMNATPKVLLAGMPEGHAIVASRAAGGASRAAAGEVAEGATLVQDVLAESQVFFRTMSQEHFDILQATGKLPATSETFISPRLEYASQYNGITVQFNLQAGTTESLLGIGVRNAGLSGGAYGSLPLVQRGWFSNSAFFKLEGNVVNIGLGRGSALNIFNNNIVNFNRVPKP